jgi:broad specificity phosphatase PhoE
MGLHLIIVRHGETEWNKEDKLQGQTDVVITMNGIKQANEIAELLKNEKIDTIYSSDLSRAIVTAGHINKYHNCKIVKSKFLREINLGDANGTLRSDLAQKFPEFMEAKKKDYFNASYPNGESYKGVQERVKKFLSEIKEKNGTILVVAHQGFNRTLIGYLGDIDDLKMTSIEVPHDVIYFVDAETKKVQYKRAGQMYAGYLLRDNAKFSL